MPKHWNEIATMAETNADGVTSRTVSQATGLELRRASQVLGLMHTAGLLTREPRPRKPSESGVEYIYRIKAAKPENPTPAIAINIPVRIAERETERVAG